MVKNLAVIFSATLLIACSESSNTTQTSQESVEQQEQRFGWLNPQDIEQAEALKLAALESSTGFDVVESLTTEIGPRLGGSENDKRAVEWGVAKLRALGFDKVYTEEVRFPSWVRVEESANVISPFPQSLHISALGNSVSTPDGGLRSKIVHFSSLEELQKAERADVEGKIVFISKKMEAYIDGRGYGAVVNARSKGAVEAGRLGAAGILIRSIGTDSDRFPHTGYMRYEQGVQKIPAAALSNPDADMLMRQLSRGKDVIVDMQIKAYEGPQYVSHNVIGEITGSETPHEIVLIGAHLDSWDLGTGALDDGAGIGITVGAAYLIKSLGLKPKRTIRVVMFANEEQGLWGGKAYAKAHQDELADHIVGIESDFGAGLIYRWDYNATAEAQETINAIADTIASLGIELGNNGTGGGPDLIHSVEMGMNVAALRQDGIDYFNYHHTANDTLDKIHPEKLQQNVAAYAVVAYLIAQMDGRLMPFTPKSKGMK
jgi:carboxypeptidase Q